MSELSKPQIVEPALQRVNPQPRASAGRSGVGLGVFSVGLGLAELISAGQATSVDLAPFRFSRFVEGELHPVSNSPFPWA